MAHSAASRRYSSPFDRAPRAFAAAKASFARTSISLRSGVHIVPRDFFRIPIQIGRRRQAWQ
jgi:hypothetical protein